MSASASRASQVAAFVVPCRGHVQSMLQKVCRSAMLLGMTRRLVLSLTVPRILATRGPTVCANRPANAFTSGLNTSRGGRSASAGWEAQVRKERKRHV